jgi:hypothetical protein
MWAAIQQAPSAFDWPPGAIHDTVAAIVRQRAYSQSIAQSLLGRFIQWAMHRLDELFRFFRDTPGARPFVIAATALLVMAVVARVIVSGRARDARHRASLPRGAGARHADPLARAHAHAAAGQYTEAAHSL